MLRRFKFERILHCGFNTRGSSVSGSFAKIRPGETLCVGMLGGLRPAECVAAHGERETSVSCQAVTCRV